MPIYEYRCDECGAVFSHLFRSIQAAEGGAAPACPECGSANVQRLISSVAVLSGDTGPDLAEASKPAPPPLFGRKEIQERMRQERNRRSIARVDDE